MKPICLLFLALGLAYGYPNGAPPEICSSSEQIPLHGSHQAKPSPAPYDIFMSKDQVTSLDDTITVTIKARSGGPKFKGFLVSATNDDNERIGTWENNISSQSLTCHAVTHVGPDEKQEVILTWKPLDNVPVGKVHMKAVIVQLFNKFWTEIPVPVLASGSISLQKTLQDAATLTSKVTTKVEAKNTTTVMSPKLKKRSLVDRIFGEDTTTTSKTTTSKPTTTITTTTKKGSLINRLFGSATTTTTTPKPTTTPTTIATTTKRGLINRLFGSDTTTTTKKTTTPKPTTTTLASTTTKRRSIINRVFGGGTTTPTPTTKKTTIKTTTIAATTTQQGFINRFFGGGTSTPTTKKPKPTTTTTAASTTTKRRSLINRVFGGDTTTTTTTTTTRKPTTTPTTQKPGFFSGLFGDRSN